MFKFNRLFLVACLASGLSSTMALAKEKVKVITSFSVLGDIVQEIGGDKIALTTLVSENGDAHTFKPSPKDVRGVSKADLIVINGLGFEGWLPRLIEASHFKGIQVIASNGIAPLEGHHDEHQQHKNHEKHHDGNKGDDDHNDHEAHDQHKGHETHHQDGIDPHAWHSIRCIETYARNIANGLARVDSENSAYYTANLTAYLLKLNALDNEIKKMFDTVPVAQRKVIVAHDAFAYFSRDYAIEFYALQGTSTESEASASDIAGVIDQIRDENIKAIFIENVTDNRLIKQISQDTKVTVAGKLYSDALSGKDEQASTYLEMMKYNATTIFNAIK